MPFQRERYPPDWPAISLRIRTRAGWRCEWCGAENGRPNPATGSRVPGSADGGAPGRRTARWDGRRQA